MKAKLIKSENHQFILEDIDGSFIATIDNNDSLHKLSLKNCEAIELGYDLDWLSESYALEVHDKVTPDEDYQDYANFVNRKRNFEEGFQKALEVNKDKKYTGNNMLEFADKMYKVKTQNSLIESFPSIVKSLQKTEWEVEVIMEQYVKYVPKSFETVYPTGGVRPKLDDDGCLFLKRI